MDNELSFSPRGFASLMAFPFQNRETLTRFLFLGGFFTLGWVFPLLPCLMGAGYLVEVLRLATQGGKPALPPWENWGRLLVNGLKALGAGLIFLLPACILILKAWALYFALVFSVVGIGGRGEDALAFFLMMFAMTVLFVFQGLGFLLYLAGGTLLQPALTHMAVRDTFSALFDFKGWWRVFKASKGAFIVIFLLGLMLLYLLQLGLAVIFPLWIFLLFLLPALTSFGVAYILTILAWLNGTAYAESLSASGEPS
jgi:hypothetical protein